MTTTTEALKALESQIMNLPAKKFAPGEMNDAAYEFGHRDARHAAAELVSAALAAQQPAEPDMRHPKIQALIGSNARRNIELSIAEDLLDDPEHEISGTDGDYWLPLHDKIVALQQRAAAPAVQPSEKERTAILKGVGRINGDGWKDVTRIGEVVYVWNDERPTPYAPGQFPRIGNDCGWTASREQYDFTPATLAEVRECFDALLAQERERVLQGVKGQFEQMLAADRALRLEQPAEAVAPLGYISPKQLPLIVDPDDESGVYIPMRKTAKGNFTLAVFAAAPSAQPVARRLTPFGAVARAMDLASLLAGSVAMNDTHKAGDYSQRLRSHLIEFIYPPEVAAAPSAPQPETKGGAA